MAKRNERFPSRSLTVDDLQKDGKPGAMEMTVDHVEVVTFDGRDKPVAHFRGTEKTLPLNGVNWDSLAKISGKDDDDNWAGTVCEVYRTQTEFKGQNVPCIRIRPVGGWDNWAGPNSSQAPAGEETPEWAR